MQNKPMKAGPSLQMLRRTLILASVCGIVAFGVLLCRLYTLQIRDHERYETLAESQQLRTVRSNPNRGTITDRNGSVLAISASVDNVYLSGAEIESNGEDRELIADGLSEILDIDRETVMKKASESASWYVTVKKGVEQETAERVRAFKEENGLLGIRLETDSKRYYPNSTLACHVIGFVGTDQTGLEGLEARYDTYLRGESNAARYATNAAGNELGKNGLSLYETGSGGCDIRTTLDATIQYYVEKHLQQAVEDYDIRNGAGAIVMDVNTGAVLAMASLDNYDLNDFDLCYFT